MRSAYTFWILLALAEGPEHGLGIQKRIIGDSVGGVYVRESSLYSALAGLMRRGFIEELTGGVRGRTGRKAYRLTDEGRRVLATEARTWREGLRVVQIRLRL